MAESVRQLLAALHAERVATWDPDALKVNIDQRQTLVDKHRGVDHRSAYDALGARNYQVGWLQSTGNLLRRKLCDPTDR